MPFHKASTCYISMCNLEPWYSLKIVRWDVVPHKSPIGKGDEQAKIPKQTRRKLKKGIQIHS